MKKSELRQLITKYFSPSEWETLMFDFCDVNHEFNYFASINHYNSFDNKVAQTLLALDEQLTSKLEFAIFTVRPDLQNLNTLPTKVYSAYELREAILAKYTDESILAYHLFNVQHMGYQFQWDVDIPQRLNYANKVMELVKYFQRRNSLPFLAKHLGV